MSGTRVSTREPRCQSHPIPDSGLRGVAWRWFYRVLLRLVWERINMPNDRANHARPLNDGNVSGAETEKRGNQLRRVIAVLGQEWME